MIRTYKYLLRPSDEQAKSLDFLLWQSRLVYNAALTQRISTYKETCKGVNYCEQWKHFRDLRHETPETFGKLNASSLQHTLRRLEKAFTAFFDRVKKGENPGYPRFKSRKRFRSIEYTYGDGCKLRQDKNGRRSFYIQNVGEIRMCYHRAIPESAKIKHVVVKQTNERWYICLMLELPEKVRLHPTTGKQVGLDIGLKTLAALSTGELIENPRWLQKSLIDLRQLFRHAARQVKGSKRQRKTYVRIARLNERISNQRKDYLHKISNSLVRDNDFIAIEDLSLDFMNRNGQLALSSYDAGFGLLRQMLEYKAEEAGIPIIAVNPYNTSQACSNCGCIIRKNLNVRVHHCSNCGLILDRDVNAARNILKEAIRIPHGRCGQAVTWAVTPSVA